ncbi:hypothetical protein SDC9_95384 [bioreactor metagenome]|uniref:Uncharacterized protein n=1 Tax=bioreactor metagenome TaxID=1076179 RepID=A0A645A7I8_9ZZZZ
MILTEEYIRPVECLFVNQLTQLEQKRISRNVVQPIGHHQVISSALFSPECPVTQRRVRQLLQLIFEIICHKGNYPFIPGCGIVLLHYFQHHHFRPPVVSVVSLQAFFGFPVGIRAKVSVWLLRCQRPLNPGLHFLF